MTESRIAILVTMAQLASVGVAQTSSGPSDQGLDSEGPLRTLAAIERALEVRDHATFGSLIARRLDGSSPPDYQVTKLRERMEVPGSFHHLETILDSPTPPDEYTMLRNSALRGRLARKYGEHAEMRQLVFSVREAEGVHETALKGFFRARLVFVEQQGGWAWIPLGQFGADGWLADLSTPTKALEALETAIKELDSAAVFDMIDPDLTEHVPRLVFVSEAHRRLQRLQEWEQSRGGKIDPSRLQYKLTPPPVDPVEAAKTEQGRKRLEEWRLEQIERANQALETTEQVASPPPCVALRPITGQKEVEEQIQGGLTVAHVWRLNGAGQRTSSETFVRKDGLWLWRPAADYTAWPLRARQPSSR